MFVLSKELIPGMVVWSYKAPYYDDPNKMKFNAKGMYLITKVNYDYFFGCPIVAGGSPKNSTMLHKSVYPLKYDSRVNECIYKIPNSDIISNHTFQLLPKTFEYFKRKMYERIALGYAEGITEYNDIFANDYLNDHIPKVGNVISYPSEEKKLRYYYIYDEDKSNYILISLDKEDYNYSLHDTKKIVMPKKTRFYTYYENAGMDHDKVDEIIMKEKQERKTKARLEKEMQKGADLQVGAVISTHLYCLLDGSIRDNQKDKDLIVIGSNDNYHYVIDSNYNPCYVPIYKVSRKTDFKEEGMATIEHLKNALLSCRDYCMSNQRYADSSSFKMLRKALDY